jgi:hypothetical protein
MVATKIQTRRIPEILKLFTEVVLGIEEQDLQRFMEATSLKGILAIYDAVTKLDASPRTMRRMHGQLLQAA